MAALNACREKIWFETELTVEKTTARYVLWFVQFVNSKLPERHFAPLSWLAQVLQDLGYA
jgi:hypothetical protein